MSDSTETKETMEEFKERLSKEYGPIYFDRQGNELELMEWARKCEDHDYKILKQEEIDRYFVSTVWVGLNMQMFRKAPKQIFETMIFLIDEEEKDPDDPLYMYQERYSTEEEAFLGHENALSIIRTQLLNEEQSRIMASQEKKNVDGQIGGKELIHTT